MFFSGLPGIPVSKVLARASKQTPLFALLIVAVTGIACGFCFKAAAENGDVAQADSQVSQAHQPATTGEAERRSAELSKQGFSFPFIVDTDGRMPIELWVEPFDNNVISLWFEAADGLSAIDVLGPDGRRVASWSGQSEEQRFDKVVAGTYIVVVKALEGAHVHGVIGIKGPANANACHIDGGRLTEHPPDGPSYWWPYLLITPASPAAASVPRPLLVVPNNTWFATGDIEVVRAVALCAVSNHHDIDALKLSDNLDTPILVPLFPRPELTEISSNLELQALTRASFEEIPPRSSLERVDLQLMAMIDAARKRLTDGGWPVREQVLIAGLSAAGSFTNRFTMLHPERVLAAAVGSPGGWPIAPVAADQSKTLRYPVGIADVENLTGILVDLAALRRVRFLFFLGDTDTNDAVGSTDSYSAYDSELIKCLFGKTMLERWRSAKRLYDDAGMSRAQFKVYPGGHEVTLKMWNDILKTFRDALSKR